MDLSWLVLIGFAANLAGSFAFIRDTVKGSARPHRVSYLMWSIAPFIASAAGFSDGVTWAVVPILSASLCPFLIFIASFFARDGIWKIGKMDWLCGALSLLALYLWWRTSHPAIAILFSILSDAAACAPTFKKGWTNPETETPVSYLLGCVGPITILFALQRYDFVEMAFPVYLFVVCVGLYLVPTLRKAVLARRLA